MGTTEAVVRRPLPPVPRAGDPQETRQAAAQQFVAGMRARAAGFAAAGGALRAVVAEVVPPARHRRARCRLVLRRADGAQSDTTFLGPAGAPTLAAREWFDGEIRRWLATGSRPEAPRPKAPPPEAPSPGDEPAMSESRVVDICLWALAD